MKIALLINNYPLSMDCPFAALTDFHFHIVCLSLCFAYFHFLPF